MIVTEQLQQEKEKLQFLVEMKKQMEEKEDQVTAKKVEDLIQKAEQNVLNIGLCGHFSAGKSSMINKLIGAELLPSSPIPTSANLVVVQYGEPKAIISMTDGEQLTVPTDQINKWKQYCKDGHQVKKVAIQTTSSLLDGGVQLLDTPGIDSTDQAHHDATEAALHLADIILFVTDYNHVQSEGNFQFIKRLKEKGKRTILIVNQIDKHREEELSIQAFHQKMLEGLASWGVTVDALLFTSLKEQQHPYNQFEQLIGFIQEIKNNKSTFIQQQLRKELQDLWNQHGNVLKEQAKRNNAEKAEQIDSLKQQWDWDNDPNFFSSFNQSEQKAKRWKTEAEKEIIKILENAIITPYQTMQYAQAFIESRQKDFKVGLFFSKKKTEEERDKRAEQLYQNLLDQTQSQVEWHVKETLKKLAGQYELHDDTFTEAITNWSETYQKERLFSTVRQDTVAHDYVYTFAKEIRTQIQQQYKQSAFVLLQQGCQLLEQGHLDTYSRLQEKVTAYQQIDALTEQLDEANADVDQYVQEKIKQIEAYLPLEGKDSNSSKYNSTEFDIDVQDNASIQLSTKILNQRHRQQTAKKTENHNNMALGRKESPQWLDGWTVDTSNVQQMANRLSQASDKISQLPNMSAWVHDLAARAERLQDNRFTVCLFGAFSAGKSSFINALLGESVLPVSPNPTTAAINQLLPATEDNPSGTAVIAMKSKETLESQVRIALERLQLTTSGHLYESVQQIKQLNPTELRSSLKAYYTFLDACLKGWKDAQDLLGQEIQTIHEEFTQFVAVETKACFVESIRLYLDHPLLERGMEFIDTPGADSIYSRHTNVTFEYVKHADVILYVTYYNHASSQADRQFLDQLGRVKDQFALDKMFFLVNASDLASSEEELNLVVEHVQQELLKSGIRFPRIFPVSSLEVLKGKEEKGFLSFLDTFSRFLADDVTDLLTQSAEQELHKIQQVLLSMKEDLQSSQEEKQQKIEEAKQVEVRLLQRIQQRTHRSIYQDIEREVKEHTYYVKQRLFHHFTDHMNEAFHPSVLNGTGNMKQKLISCFEELWFQLSYVLKEELRATGLRMENYLVKEQTGMTEEWKLALKQEQLYLTDIFSEFQLEQPPIPEQLKPLEDKERQHYLRFFKSPKAFFEGDGKDKLRTELEEHLQNTVNQYLDGANQSLIQFYQNAWEKIYESYRIELHQQIRSLITSRIQALQGGLSEADLAKVIHQFEQIL